MLVYCGIDFPKSHDIAALRRLLPSAVTQDPGLHDAAVLTDYAVSARYPGEREPLTQTDVAAAAKLAAAVVRWARKVVAPSHG